MQGTRPWYPECFGTKAAQLNKNTGPSPGGPGEWKRQRHVHSNSSAREFTIVTNSVRWPYTDSCVLFGIRPNVLQSWSAALAAHNLSLGVWSVHVLKLCNAYRLLLLQLACKRRSPASHAANFEPQTITMQLASFLSRALRLGVFHFQVICDQKVR